MSVLGDDGLLGFEHEHEFEMSEVAKPGLFGPSVGIIVGLFVIAALFGLVAFHASIASNQTQLDHFEQEISNSYLENDRLELIVAQMESPVRIVEAAQGRLGMIEPVSVIYLTPPVEVVPTGAIRGAFAGAARDNSPVVVPAATQDVAAAAPQVTTPAAVETEPRLQPTALPLVVVGG